ncbi:CapA family protein [Paenibacillus sp. sgz302251]|uniref:CapA family protein n=1 Tax=Paenibacillus sp. sgz302251 TaxID=3414493 RepID=UPI003C7A2106
MQRTKQRRLQLILLLLSVIGLFIIYLLPWRNDLTSYAPDATPALLTEEQAQASTSPAVIEPSTAPPEPVYSDAVWMAVGDIMMHMPQLPGSYDQATGRYNFNSVFTEVKPLLEQGDWVIANLETPIAGIEFGYSGYPQFNAPVELAEALKAAGFNLITNANNHSLDKGENGLLRTLENLKALDLPTAGTAASQKEADTPLLIEKNGIAMGLLAYTYGTNGIPVPAGKPYLVSLIDEKKIKEDIKRLREAGADFIMVSLHFGTEYQPLPNEEQKRLARALIAAGADIIAGSHPHVVQPYEVIEKIDENGHVKKGLIIYSMGNFLSNQRGDTKDYGVIFKVSIRKNWKDGSVDLTEIEAVPTWVHRYKPDQSYRYRILPIEATIASSSDTLLTQADYDVLRTNYELLRNRLDSLK